MPESESGKPNKSYVPTRMTRAQQKRMWWTVLATLAAAALWITGGMRGWW